VRYIGQFLIIFLDVAICLLMARAVISWVKLLFPRLNMPRLVLQVFDIIYKVTEPPLRWLRRYVRPVGAGGVSLDLSFMVWFIALLLVQRIVFLVFF